MCGRYSLVTDDGDRLDERFGRGPHRLGWPATSKHYNIAPGDQVAVVTAEAGPRLMTWGVRKAINARAETADSKFRGLQRCLVPADGFYEWRHGRPHHVAQAGGAPFAMAGLHTSQGMVVVTCPPSAAVSALHDRMPVILPPEAEDDWLAGAAVGAVARPFEALVLREVSRAVNDARHDGPDCLGPPEQLALI